MMSGDNWYVSGSIGSSKRTHKTMNIGQPAAFAFSADARNCSTILGISQVSRALRAGTSFFPFGDDSAFHVNAKLVLRLLVLIRIGFL
jgi:hypothetical protein